MNRQPVSAVIITLNEATRLPACLQSLTFVDEIVVVDSGSTDQTVSLARAAGAKVVRQEWLGYGRQKQFAVEQAAHDWVLCIDADEQVSKELQDSILAALQKPGSQAYRMTRCNRFMGRWLQHGEGYPDWCLRLFQRRHARWTDDAVHERVAAQGSIGSLRGDLLHESQETLKQYLEKQNRYTSLQAEILHRQGRQVTLARLIFSPLLRFFKMYIMRLGFLDGLPGLVHIVIGCFNSFSKYAKLLELNRSASSTAPQ